MVLFEKVIKDVLREICGDPKVQIIDQKDINQKKRLLINHSTLRTTFRSKDESRSESNSYKDMHLKIYSKIVKQGDQFVRKVSRGFITENVMDWQDDLFVKGNFYYDLLELYLQKSHIGQKWSPKFYELIAIPNGYCMLFEDVTLTGYVKKDIFDNDIYIRFVIRALARFHCSSIIADARLKENYRDPDFTLKDKFVANLEELMFDCDWSMVSKFYDIGIELACVLASKLFKHDPLKLRNVLKKASQLVRASEKHCNVVCHGDLRPENMFFTSVLDEPKCLLHNFYLIRYAPLALDLLQLFYLNMSRDCRTEYEYKLIDFYTYLLHTSKADFLRVPGTVLLPTEEEIIAAYLDLKLFGPTAALVYLSLSLLNVKDNVGKLTQDCLKNWSNVRGFLTKNKVQACKTKMLDNMRVYNQFKELSYECMEFADF